MPRPSHLLAPCDCQPTAEKQSISTPDHQVVSTDASSFISKPAYQPARHTPVWRGVMGSLHTRRCCGAAACSSGRGCPQADGADSAADARQDQGGLPEAAILRDRQPVTGALHRRVRDALLCILTCLASLGAAEDLKLKGCPYVFRSCLFVDPTVQASAAFIPGPGA